MMLQGPDRAELKDEELSVVLTGTVLDEVRAAAGQQSPLDGVLPLAV